MCTLRSVHWCICLECLESCIPTYTTRSQVAPAPRPHPRRLGCGAETPGNVPLLDEVGVSIAKLGKQATPRPVVVAKGADVDLGKRLV